jgi:hypothetical protein
MAIINNVNEVLHRVRVKLYQNYLQGIEGAYVARTDDEASLNIEQVCAAMKNRGGFTGNYDDLVEHVREFFDEAAYQLCDGFSINTGYYSLHPKIGGTFDTVKEGIDEKKHPVTFTFRTRNPLRELAKRIEIFVEGVADVQGYIDEVLDVTTGAVNETLTAGGVVVFTGSKIKVVGDKPGVGITLTGTRTGGTPYTDSLAATYAENSPSKVIAVLPPTIPGDGQFALKITTQYTTGGTFLKVPRVISSVTFKFGSQ